MVKYINAIFFTFSLTTAPFPDFLFFSVERQNNLFYLEEKPMKIHVCEDYAKRNNIVIVDSYIDRAISGTTDERESFQRMLKDSNNRKWNYVLVYKLDRFARNQ